jgi:hypothetical protein
MKHLFLLIWLLLLIDICHATHDVRGRVVSLDNAGIGGVNVLLRGTSLGTATNMSGEFRISIPEGPVILRFSLLKFQSVEQAFTIREGYQYHIIVFLARTNQSFNKSSARVGELSLNSPVIRGVILDQHDQPLAGVSVTHVATTFSAITDRDGKFALPVARGNNSLLFFLPGFKKLDVAFDIDSDLARNVEVILVRNQDRTMSSASFKADR